MRQIVGEVRTAPSGVVRSGLRVELNGTLDHAVTHTLVDLVEQSWPVIDQLLSLVEQAEQGTYVSPNEALPDWSANDVCAWLGKSHAPRGSFTVTNENTEYTYEDGKAQTFTFREFQQVVHAQRQFRAAIAEHGKEALVGKRYEFKFAQPGDA